MKGEPEEKEKRRKHTRAESKIAGQSWSFFSSRAKQVTEVEMGDLD